MKNIIALIFALICCATASAKPYQAEIDGICYTRLNSKEAMVTFYDYNETTNSQHYRGSFTIPNIVTFNGHTYTVTTIGAKAFRNCWFIKNLILPDSLTTINDEAFYYSSIEHLYIGAKLQTLGKDVFYNACIDYTDFDSANPYFVCEGDVLYTADHKRAISLMRNNHSTNNQKIKVYLHDDVVTIDDGFSNASRLDSVRFGKNIKSIGDQAFWFAFADPGLQKALILPDGIEHIGREAFKDCYCITSLHLPDSLTRLEPYSFSYVGPSYIHMPKKLKVICDGALACDGGGMYRNLVLPEGLDSIGVSGITCIACESLIVPSSVRYLSVWSLDNYSRYIEIRAQLDSIPHAAMPSQAVEKLVLPKSLKKIGDTAFYPCYWLKEIVWPDNLQYIGNFALAGNRINPLIVPSTVKTLDYGAFASSSWDSRSYYFMSKTPPTCLDNDICYGINYEGSTLYVPQGCRNAYANKAPWNWFGTIKEYGDDFLDIEGPSVESSAGMLYDITGKPVSDSYKGIVIRNGKQLLRR